MAQLCELGEVVKLVSKTHCSVQNLGAGAQTADRFSAGPSGTGAASWTASSSRRSRSLWADIAELSLNPRVRFLLLGDFRQLPAVLDAFGGAPVTKPLRNSRLLHDLAGGCYHELTENHRSDEAIFGWRRRRSRQGAATGPGALPEAGAAGHLPAWSSATPTGCASTSSTTRGWRPRRQ